MKSSIKASFFTLLNDQMNMSLVIVLFAPMVLGKNAIFLQGASLSAKTVHVGILLALFPLSQFITSPIFGSFSDTMGRKNTLIFALLGLAFFNALAAFSIDFHHLELLYIARILSGAFAGNAPLAQASIADLSTEENKGKNLSYIGIVSSLGWIIGAPLGGILSNNHILSWLNFSVPFWFSAILFLFNALWILLTFEKTKHPLLKDKISFSKELKNIVQVFHIPQIKIPLVTFFLYYLGWMMYIYFFPTVFVKRFDFTQSEIGYAAAFAALCFSFGSFIIKKYGTKDRMQPFLLWALFLCSAVVLLSTFVPVFWPFIPIFLIACSTSAIVWISFLTILSNLAGKEHQGKVFGVQQSMQAMSTVLSPLIAGFITPLYIGMPFFMAGILLLIGFLLYLKR